MVFVGAIDVEELDAGDGRKAFFAVGPHVEKLLGPAVGIERFEPERGIDAVGKAHRTVAVGGGAAGVDEAHAPLHRAAAKQFAVLDVVFHEEIDIAFRRRGTGTQMDDAVDLVMQAVVFQHLAESVAVQIIGETAVDQIVPFLARSQIVHHDDVVDAHLVQFPDHRAADESGAACHDIHVDSPVCASRQTCRRASCRYAPPCVASYGRPVVQTGILPCFRPPSFSFAPAARPDPGV